MINLLTVQNRTENLSGSTTIPDITSAPSKGSSHLISTQQMFFSNNINSQLVLSF